jgi:uncharacterized protein YndB with AHSA1/START domain
LSNVRGTAADENFEVEIEIEAPADAVFDHLVVPHKLVRWMGSRAEIDPRPDGQLWLEIDDGGIAVGRYIEVVRPEKVSFTWGWHGSESVPPGSSTVEITLSEKAGITLVRLVHRGLGGDERTKHLKGWLHFGGELADVVAGRGSAATG